MVRDVLVRPVLLYRRGRNEQPPPVIAPGRGRDRDRRTDEKGEMDAKELFETTMDPAKRKLLRIDLTDAVEAEEMFTKLMGDEVEPRRQFIEDNALNVRNLDI